MILKLIQWRNYNKNTIFRLIGASQASWNDKVTLELSEDWVCKRIIFIHSLLKLWRRIIFVTLSINITWKVSQFNSPILTMRSLILSQSYLSSLSCEHHVYDWIKRFETFNPYALLAIFIIISPNSHFQCFFNHKYFSS